MCIKFCSFLSCFLSWVSRAHLAAIFLWTAGILCSISFVSPFWLTRVEAKAYLGWSMPCERINIGLLGECCVADKETECTWVWENRFRLERQMEGWRRVIQFLFLSGLLLLLPVLIMSPFRFCCKCGRMSVRMSKVFAGFTSLSACLCGSAAIYFFYHIIWVEGGTKVIDSLSYVSVRSWAFSMGGVGICFTLVSSMFWYLDSMRQVGSVTIQNQNEQNRGRRGFLKR